MAAGLRGPGGERKSWGKQRASNYPAVGSMAREILSNMSRPSKKPSTQSMGGWPPEYACITFVTQVIDVTSGKVVQEHQ